MLRASTLAAGCLWAAGLAPAADWPQWRGPNRDGVSTEKGLLTEWPKEGPKLAWKVNLGGSGYSAPVVAGGKVFVTAAADDVKGTKEFAVCLGAKDGTEVWKKELPTGPGGYSTDWGSGPRSAPTVDGDRVYTLGARGDLSCLSTKDGGTVWAKNLVKDFGGSIPGWGYSEGVLIDGDNLVCTPGGKNGTVLALDKKTGAKVWQCAELKDGAAYASLVAADLAGERQYVTQTSSAAVGVRAKDGKLLWRVAELKRAVAVIPTPVVQGDFVFFTTGYGAGCELLKIEAGDDAVKATTVYTRNPVLANQHGGVVRVGDHVYGHTDRGNRWVCYDFKKGGEEFAWESNKLDKGSLTAAGGMLYCYGQGKGTCALVEASPEGWKEKGRFEIPEKSKLPRRAGQIWTHPVVADGRLYLRDHEILFCFDVAAK